MLWPSPEMLLVAQAVIVALGALPAFWLGRRWLGDDRLAVAGAVDLPDGPRAAGRHPLRLPPVTLAAPLLLFCIWAAEEARWITLGVCATLAVLCQEQVGLLIAALAVWLWFRHPARRRAAVLLGVGGLAWVVIAMGVIMPAFALKGVNPHLSRYSSLGDGPGEILVTFLTRPWEAVAILATPGRIGYVLGLLLPTLLLALAAPLLAAVALPQLVINLFASTGPAQTVEYHYAVLLVPVLVAATLLGLARLRARPADGPARPAGRRPRTGGRGPRRRDPPDRACSSGRSRSGAGCPGDGRKPAARLHGRRARPRHPGGGRPDPRGRPRCRPPTTPAPTCPTASGSTSSRS